MNELTNRLAKTLEESLFVELEASGRHVHLTKEDAQTLFGHGLNPRADLSQPGQYACMERVTLLGPRGKLERVAVLGPCRGESQAEISLTDAVALGIDAPVRLSGDLRDAAPITLVGDTGKVELPHGAIVAKRHMHMTPQDAQKHGLKDRDTVSIRTFTDRSVIFEGVQVRVNENFATRVHLDYDEANACHFRKGDLGMILHG